MAQIFFQVVGASPQTKKVLRAAHLPRSENEVVVHMLLLLPNVGPDDGSLAVVDTGKWGRIDLAAIDLFAFLQCLQVWQEARPLMPRLTLPQSAKAAVEQLEAMRGAAATVSLRSGIGYVQDPGNVWQTSHDLLAFLDDGGYYDIDDKYCPQEHAPTWDADIITILASCNVVDNRVNDFGEREVALVRDSLAWRSGMAISAPCKALGLAPLAIESASKFELMALLWREGWDCRDLVLEPQTPEGARVFSLTMSLRSRRYFVALASCEEIFAKGVTRIFHNCPDGYYRWLLQLGAESMEALHNHPHFEALGNQDFVQALAGKPLLALAGEANGDFVADDDVGESLAIVERPEGVVDALGDAGASAPMPL